MEKNKKIRLTNREIETIKRVAKEIFSNNTKVYLFGSRTNINKKGGDIDLLIIPENKIDLFNKRLKYLVKLKMELGEQKIDVVIPDYDSKRITNIALKTGVLL